MLDLSFNDPNRSLIDSTFDDDVEVDHLAQDQLTLRKSFRNLLTKKRIAILSGVFFSVLLVIGLTLTGVFVSRARYSDSFRSNLENHIKAEFASIDRKLIDSYVDELAQLYRDRKISYDHVLELETMFNFEKFNKQYNRVHSSHEERIGRFMVFRNKYRMVKTHKGHETYQKEINSFADMSDEEFNKLFPPLKVPKNASPSSHVDSLMTSRSTNQKFLENLAIAKSLTSPVTDVKEVSGEGLDWRKCNGVTKVKDQGLCGSCWAFASVGSVESLYKIHENKTLDLSEQELVDCDKNSNGCNGGFGDSALEYIKKNGVSHSVDMPYHSRSEKCSVKSHDKVFINSFTITRGLDILNKSLVLSPTVVYIAASNELTMYKSGVYNGSCARGLNHAVLLVGEGYDELLGKRYWIIKNSWGPYWGEDGYLRLERTNQGSDKCGVLDTGMTPSL